MLRQVIDVQGGDICHHLTISAFPIRGVIAQLPELVNWSTLGYFAPCSQSYGSCPSCPTDYCIDITWHGTRMGYKIQVRAYRQVGDCRSPFSWDWAAFTELRPRQKPRSLFPLEYGPGSIRDRWNKADGIEGGDDSVWVNPTCRPSYIA